MCSASCGSTRAGCVVVNAGDELLPFVFCQGADDEAADLLFEVVEVAPDDSLPEPHGEFPVAARVPETDCVVAGGCERASVGAEGDAEDEAFVAEEDGRWLVAS